MSNDLKAAIKFILTQSWQFFSLTVPGTNFTIGFLFITIVLINFGLNILGWILGSSMPSEVDAPEIQRRGLVPVPDSPRRTKRKR